MPVGLKPLPVPRRACMHCCCRWPTFDPYSRRERTAKNFGTHGGRHACEDAWLVGPSSMHARVLACVPTTMLIRHRPCMSRIHRPLLRATVHLRAAYNHQGSPTSLNASTSFIYPLPNAWRKAGCDALHLSRGFSI